MKIKEVLVGTYRKAMRDLRTNKKLHSVEWNVGEIRERQDGKEKRYVIFISVSRICSHLCVGAHYNYFYLLKHNYKFNITNEKKCKLLIKQDEKFGDESIPFYEALDLGNGFVKVLKEVNGN